MTEQSWKEFWQLVDKQVCWLWRGPLDKDGYPYFHSKRTYALDFTYGPAPTGVDRHHTCEVRYCINPDHIELLSRREHNSKQFCKQGHQLQKRGGRNICVECQRISARDYYRRKQA